MENEDDGAFNNEGNFLLPEDALVLERLRQQLRSSSIGQARPSSSQRRQPRSLDSLRLQRMRQSAQQPGQQSGQQSGQQPRKRFRPTLAARRPPSPPVPTAPPNSPAGETEEN